MAGKKIGSFAYKKNRQNYRDMYFQYGNTTF